MGSHVDGSRLNSGEVNLGLEDLHVLMQAEISCSKNLQPPGC